MTARANRISPRAIRWARWINIVKPIDPEILKSKVAVFVELYRKN